MEFINIDSKVQQSLRLFKLKLRMCQLESGGDHKFNFMLY